MIGQVYLISSIHNPLLVKIGRTKNWSKRRSQLKVGRKAVEELVVECNDMCLLEKQFHENYQEYRLPGTEWFLLPYEQAKTELHSDMLIKGRQKYPLLVDSKNNGKVSEEISIRKLPRDHPLIEQLDDFCDYWNEGFTDLAVSNPWVVEWCWQWEEDGGLFAWITYINPRGEEEEMCFHTHELGKIHVQIENWETSCELTWHHEFLGRNNFDILFKSSLSDHYSHSMIESTYKNTFGVFEFFENLPYETWPLRVKASKLAKEQKTLESEVCGPSPSPKELLVNFEHANDEQDQLVK